MPINPYIAAPVAPHDFVDDEGCICGAKFEEFRRWHGKNKAARFSEAAGNLRVAFGGYESGGGYRGRGTILWMMRVMKLAAWYEEHHGCEALKDCHEGEKRFCKRCKAETVHCLSGHCYQCSSEYDCTECSMIFLKPMEVANLGGGKNLMRDLLLITILVAVVAWASEARR